VETIFGTLLAIGLISLFVNIVSDDESKLYLVSGLVSICSLVIALLLFFFLLQEKGVTGW
jgi:Na+/melibiose symporter-like transporter